MYEKAYKDASTVADKIRSEAYTGIVRDKKGFFDKKELKPVGGGDPQKDNMRMVLSYMTGLRDAHTETMSSLPDRTPMGPRIEGDLGGALDALATVESDHKYDAKGPVVTKGMYKGQRALGKYQVMEGNVGPWTQEALGKKLTPAEFLANRDAQEKVAAYRMQKYYDQHGSWEDAASVWFTGRPLSKAGNSSDGYHTVDQYVNKFQNAMKKKA